LQHYKEVGRFVQRRTASSCMEAEHADCVLHACEARDEEVAALQRDAKVQQAEAEAHVKEKGDIHQRLRVPCVLASCSPACCGCMLACTSMHAQGKGVYVLVHACSGAPRSWRTRTGRQESTAPRWSACAHSCAMRRSSVLQRPPKTARR
jgi:hypothetical protein